jgi:hypothetical protein
MKTVLALAGFLSMIAWVLFKFTDNSFLIAALGFLILAKLES